MILSNKIRLKPNVEQENQIWKSVGTARLVYNWTLAKQEENYRNGGKFISDKDLPLTRTFEVIKIMYDIEDDIFKERLEYFVERLEMEEILDSPVRSLSLGERVKADIVAALIYSPKIIYFDEVLTV